MLLCVNQLTDAQQQRVLHLFSEGLSFRAIERVTGHRRETISRYVKENPSETLRDRAALDRRPRNGDRSY